MIDDYQKVLDRMEDPMTAVTHADLLSAVRSVLNYLDECDEDSWTPRSSDIRNLLPATLTDETQ